MADAQEPEAGMPDELVDKALLGEIDLLTEVIAAVQEYSRHLTRDEVDQVLGINRHESR